MLLPDDLAGLEEDGLLDGALMLGELKGLLDGVDEGRVTDWLGCCLLGGV